MELALARTEAAPAGVTPPPHYRRPGWGTRHVLNPLVRAATVAGVSLWGSRVLEVPGRCTGVPRRTVVNLLELDGRAYLVAPRGEAEWVRNVRAARGRLSLLLGRRRWTMVAEELPADERVAVLRAYLARWKFEVGAFFDGVGPDSPDADLRRVAPRHPVFALHPVAGP